MLAVCGPKYVNEDVLGVTFSSLESMINVFPTMLVLFSCIDSDRVPSEILGCFSKKT